MVYIEVLQYKSTSPRLGASALWDLQFTLPQKVLKHKYSNQTQYIYSSTTLSVESTALGSNLLSSLPPHNLI